MIDQVSKDPEIRKLVMELAKEVTREMRQEKGVTQEYFSVKDTAKYTGMSEDYIRTRIVRGMLPAANCGSSRRQCWRIAKVDIDEFMTRQKNEPIDAPVLKNCTTKSKLPPSPHYP